MTAAIVLQGNIPAKKNSRINLRSGVSIPSKDFSKWQNDAIYQVRSQTRARFYKPVRIEVVIYFGSNIRSDLDNRLTSILDMLVEAFVLKDDKWQDVPSISALAVYRKGNPGAELTISEL